MSESNVQGEFIHKAGSQFRRLLGSMAVLLAFVPLTSSAYTIVCVGSYYVYRCADGKTIPCFLNIPNVSYYQIDCPNNRKSGDQACAKHGGYPIKEPTLNTAELYSDYQGRLDFSANACPECTSTQPIPSSYALWVASCGNRVGSLDERDDDFQLKQNNFRFICNFFHYPITEIWTIPFVPAKADP